jgi:hypothetical protein
MSNFNFFRLYPKLNGSGTNKQDFPNLGQDHFRITYTWTQGDGGTDLDTYTGFAPGTGVTYNGTSYDGVYGGASFSNWVGYQGSPFNSNIGPGTFASGNYYIAWAGDNTSTDGKEDILINLTNITSDVSLSVYNIELYGRWFSSVGTGEIDVTVELWSGGTWSDGGTVWQNSGGTLEETIGFSIDCLRGPGTGNKLDFTTYPPPNTTTYKQFGDLNFTSTGNGSITYTLDSA